MRGHDPRAYRDGRGTSAPGSVSCCSWVPGHRALKGRDSGKVLITWKGSVSSQSLARTCPRNRLSPRALMCGPKLGVLGWGWWQGEAGERTGSGVEDAKAEYQTSPREHGKLGCLAPASRTRSSLRQMVEQRGDIFPWDWHRKDHPITIPHQSQHVVPNRGTQARDEEVPDPSPCSKSSHRPGAQCPPLTALPTHPAVACILSLRDGSSCKDHGTSA